MCGSSSDPNCEQKYLRVSHAIMDLFSILDLIIVGCEMLSLHDFARIYKNYCLVYTGPEHEVVVGLVRARAMIEQTFDVSIYICCRDELFFNAPRMIKMTQIRMEKKNFAYMREIGWENGKSPVDVLLDECGLSMAK